MIRSTPIQRLLKPTWAAKRQFSQDFQAGDMVVVRECSRGGKHALIGPLTAGRQYGSRHGNLQHSSIIGRLPRDRISTNTDHKFMVHHPTLSDYVLLSSRRCTPIYPKDASTIVSMLDISAGDRILEAGTGNAGLTMYLARAVGPAGVVETVERDEGRRQHAEGIVRGFRRAQLVESVRFRVGCVAEVVDGIALELDPQLAIPEKDRPNLIAGVFDGVVLDMPTPWVQLPRIYSYVKPDRYVVCYLPSMSQVMELVRACRPWPLLVEDVVEVDWRQWDVRVARVRNPGPGMPDEAMVCRPTHQPTGHTAFLVKLRKCASDLTVSSGSSETSEPSESSEYTE